MCVPLEPFCLAGLVYLPVTTTCYTATLRQFSLPILFPSPPPPVFLFPFTDKQHNLDISLAITTLTRSDHISLVSINSLLTTLPLASLLLPQSAATPRPAPWSHQRSFF